VLQTSPNSFGGLVALPSAADQQHDDPLRVVVLKFADRWTN
jgi:hypothetical protein